MNYHFKKGFKTYYKGNHRICSPAKTKARVLKSIEGSRLPVMDGMKRIDQLDCLGIPVIAVTHPDSFNNCGKPSWGKGITEELAIVSALMERVERYSASDVNFGDFKSGRYIDFSDNAISRWDLVPCNLQRRLYSKKEIDKQKLLWTSCDSLTSGKRVYLPANTVYFFPAEEFDDFSYTTGLASGNSIEEAVLHALCEVIERHVEEVAYANKSKFPSIRTESIKDKVARKLISKFQKKGFNVFLSLMQGDFPMPIIRAFAYEKKGPYAVTFGQYTSVGVHPNREIAIIRALTEIAQARSSNRYQIKNKTENIGFSDVFPQDIKEYFFGIMDADKVIDLEDVKNMDKCSISAEIEVIVDGLEKMGCEVFYKDLTHPVLQVPVVRIVVKGLQPGNLGVGIVDLKHRAASISEHIAFFKKIEQEIKRMNY